LFYKLCYVALMIMENKMNVREFIDTWLNQEPKFNQEEFQDDTILLLEFYGVNIEKDENGKIIKIGNAT